MTAAVGVLWSGEGPGVYLRVGAGTGVNINAGIEVQVSKNLNAFGGESKGGCVGAAGFTACASTNAAGKTVAVGPKAGSADSPAPLTANLEHTYTAKFTLLDAAKAAVHGIMRVVNGLNSLAGVPAAY